MQNDNHEKRQIRISNKVIIVIFIVVFVAFGVVLLKNRRDSDVKEGERYIESQEAIDASLIENDIYAVQRTNMLAEIDQKMTEDPNYVWTALNQINTVFMGDSRAVAYGAYGFVDWSRCLADGAESIRVIPGYYETLKSINPKLIILAYGLNDVGWYWDSPDKYAEELMGYVDDIHGFLPECKIYIQSTLLPRENVDAVFNNPGLYERVREWNSAAKEIYLQNGYDYIDVGDLVEQHVDLFGSDGIHFQADFYPLLATAILKQYLVDSMVNANE